MIAETLALDLQVLNLIFCAVEQHYWQSWEIMAFLEKGIFINNGVITLKSWEVLALPLLPNAVTSMTVMGVDSYCSDSCLQLHMIPLFSPDHGVSYTPHHQLFYQHIA